MRNFLVNQIENQGCKLQEAINELNFQKAYECQVIIREIENMMEVYEEEIDIEEVINKYYYSSRQVAKKIKKSHATVVRGAQNGKLKGIKIGRDYFFKKNLIDNLNLYSQSEKER
ncbi:helix-turn-helix domain-containing protein [Ectobacillus antri]|uniref:Helix-turn-helix domain-containing protein n=1 Tax=Ectobacillus antri TaxID=2486280 RepID=A0ABT6H6I7_9BACI|nr:helix-turn-helix domain-containing protein [Ectobacillus antri]MDG4657950.1 helix-turn-helix domain-containing protein [Ectobacillus antri]MDG5754966.1 helix-turn-helix domain-containing protein [Ectobacillus antri]